MNDKRILVVDDETDLLEMVKSIFTRAGFTQILTASSGEAALKMCEEQEPDMMILDVMMPGMDGFAALKELRKTSKIPVLMLTARGEAEDKFVGFENGADDYLLKPFLPKELLFRVQAILKRVYPEKERKVFFEAATVDLEKAIVQRSGENISLTAKEFQLFEKLYENQGRIVTTGALCQAICGDFWQGYESTLATHIRHLREKIEENTIMFVRFLPSAESTLLHAFVVATHTDRQHIHNHVIFNSTALDGTRKFRDFFFSALAVQRLSDLICLEHQLSVIEKKPYRERQKRVLYPPKESNRDRLCGIIDTILAEKPGDYETFLQKLEQQGYEVKRGKYTAVKGKGQKRFIRFRTLGTGYGEDEIKAVLEGKAKHQPYQKKQAKEQPFQLLVDIQEKMAEGKSVGYKKWATKFNLKEMSKTLLFLQEQKIGSAEELRERTAAATERYHAMGDSIKAAEARLTEIAVLKTHIINYAKTRPVHDAYRKSGYSKKFLEAHREEITLHKAAKAAFDEAGLQKLPKVKELDAEFAELLTKKKAAYPDYRKARNEMQELVRAQKNVERFFAGEKDTIEKAQTR